MEQQYQNYNPYGHSRPPKHAVSQPRSWAGPKKTRLEKVNDYIKHNFGVIVLAIVIAALIIALILFVSGFLSSSQTTLHPVQQPATAAQVAKNLNCTSFTDLGVPPAGGSVDTGSCYISGKKYAINTFASKDVRDSWLKAAEPLGVNPWWMSDTAVVYPSVK